MRRKSISLLALAFVPALFADPNGDRPDVYHAWAVHDENRPRPERVEAPAGRPPSDAIVLFDGTEESVAAHWADGKGGPAKWKVWDGLFRCVPNSGSVVAKDIAGDCQIHVEFMIPDPPGDGLGNSGVYVHGLYELQVLESSGTVVNPQGLSAPWEDDYADGQLGAVYGQNPPMVNPARRPGEWQAYDIVFHPAVWSGGKLVAPAEMTVFLNGVLIQDGWKLEGPTLYCRRTSHDSSQETPARPVLLLQDHENPVPYRNIWVRKIPSRRENRVSGEFFDQKAAAALRRSLAEKTRRFADGTDDLAKKIVWLWESYMYAPSDGVLEELGAITPRYIGRISSWKGEIGGKEAIELSDMAGFVDMGVRCGMFAESSPLVVAVRRAMKATSSSVIHR